MRRPVLPAESSPESCVPFVHPARLHPSRPDRVWAMVFPVRTGDTDSPSASPVEQKTFAPAPHHVPEWRHPKLGWTAKRRHPSVVVRRRYRSLQTSLPSPGRLRSRAPSLCRAGARATGLFFQHLELLTDRSGCDVQLPRGIGDGIGTPKHLECLQGPEGGEGGSTHIYRLAKFRKLHCDAGYPTWRLKKTDPVQV